MGRTLAITQNQLRSINLPNFLKSKIYLLKQKAFQKRKRQFLTNQQAQEANPQNEPQPVSSLKSQ